MKKFVLSEKAGNICAALSAVLLFLCALFPSNNRFIFIAERIALWVSGLSFLLTPGWYKNKKILFALLLPALYAFLEVIKKGGVPLYRSTFLEGESYLFSTVTAFAFCFRLRGEKRERCFGLTLSAITLVMAACFGLSLIGMLRGRDIVLPAGLTFGAERSESGKLLLKCMSLTSYRMAMVASCFAFVCVFLYAQLQNRRLLPAFILCEGVFLAVVWLSGSRSVLIGLAAGLVLLAYILVDAKIKNRARKKQVLFAAAAVLLGALLIAIPLMYVSIGSGRSTFYGLLSLTSRTTIWSGALRLFADRPVTMLTGLPNPIFDVIGNYIPLDASITYMHNGYVQVLCLMGIPGFLLTLAYTFRTAAGCAETLRRGNSSHRTFVRKLAVPVLLVLYLQNLFECSVFVYVGKITGIIFPLFAGYILFSGEDCGENKPDTEKRRPGTVTAVISVLIPILLLALSPFGRDNTVIETVDPDTGASAPGVTAEQETPEHWMTAEGDTVLMTPEEIRSFNEKNRNALLSEDGEGSAPEDAGDEPSCKAVREMMTGLQRMTDYPGEYLLEGKPTDKAYWEKLFSNRALPGEEDTVTVGYGFSVACATLRKLPTRDAVFNRYDLHTDCLDATAYNPCMPLAVLGESADGGWYFVRMDSSCGWIEKEYVALCENREVWLAAQEPEQFLVVTGNTIAAEYTDSTGASRSVSLPMGTKLACDTAAPRGTGYPVLLPVRRESGELVYAQVTLAPDADVSEGYLPYTSNTVIRQAFQLQGVRYGFYDETGAGYDCSAMLRAVYACFGFELPGTVAEQASALGINGPKEKRSEAEKREILKKTAPGTPLYVDGRIVIYLGMDDGVPYAIGALSSYVRRNPETQIRERVYSMRTMVSNMEQTLNLKGNSWVGACGIG